MEKSVIEFTLYGEAKPQQRPRGFINKKGFVSFYSPKKEHKNFCEQLIIHKPKELFDGALKITLKFYFLKPKSKSKKVVYPCWKPDLDNLEKSILDRMEKVFYTNDSRIVEKHSYKYYDDIPRLEIKLEKLQ